MLKLDMSRWSGTPQDGSSTRSRERPSAEVRISSPPTNRDLGKRDPPCLKVHCVLGQQKFMLVLFCFELLGYISEGTGKV